MKRISSMIGVLSLCTTFLGASGIAHKSDPAPKKNHKKQTCCYHTSMQRSADLDNMLAGNNKACCYSFGTNLDLLSFQKTGNAYASMGALAIASTITPPESGEANFVSSLQAGISMNFSMMERHSNTGLDVVFEYIDAAYPDSEVVGGSHALMSTYSVDPSVLGNIQINKAVANFSPRHLGLLFYIRKASIQYGNLALNAAAGLGYENNVYNQNLEYYITDSDVFFIDASNTQRLFAGAFQVNAAYKVGHSNRFGVLGSLEVRPLVGSNCGRYTNQLKNLDDDGGLHRYNIESKNIGFYLMQKASIGFEYLFNSSVRTRDFAGKLRLAYVAEYRPNAFNASPQVVSLQGESIIATGLQTGASFTF